MSNSYFQFKQFRIEQGDTAMKVSTDACIQGAWTPILPGAKKVLDVGSGTGLLSLMLAQRNEEVQIDTVEIDEDAAAQSVQNIAASPWAHHIRVFNTDARTFGPQDKYDLVICNPPFFHNSLLGDDAARNKARHSLSLSQQELFSIIKNVITPVGYASVMFPADEHTLWEQLIQDNGWFITHCISVKDNDKARVGRVITCCCPVQQMTQSSTLVVKNSDGTYSEAFKQLLSPFYLYL